MKCDPMDKQALAETGIAIANRMVVENGLEEPKIVDMPKCGHYGFYDPRLTMVAVDIARCRVGSTSGYSWTWPHFKADLTPMGVVCHELGHHWHYTSLGKREGLSAWKKAVVPTGERPLTSYGETSVGEDIAESFKLFCTNPDLLRVLWPVRYWFFTECNLKPAVDRDWRYMLNGSPRHVEWVERRLT